MGPSWSSCPSWAPGAFPSPSPLLLWAELKKAVAQQPRGLKTLAEAFPDWEANSRWSQALKKVENSSRPYLKEVQRYEKYRCLAREGGAQADNPGSQPPWPIPAPISPLVVQSLCLL